MSRLRHLTPENTEFVVLSFEGPDSYSLAGGLGVRVNHLSSTLSAMGFPTHLFFIGDPKLAGEETSPNGKLILHRWCQWISNYHPNGVYDGESGKVRDYTDSIPGFVREHVILPALAGGKAVVVLGEEWHTTEAMCRLSDLLQAEGVRDRVIMFWNANNTFSFDRIDWNRLNLRTTITTVSRYMKHLMWRMGLNPLAIPNGIPASLLGRVNEKAAQQLRNALGADVTLCKVARWDPDKCWDAAVEATAELKRDGLRTTLVARGGIEPYGTVVMDRARSLGLEVKQAVVRDKSPGGYLEALCEAGRADVIEVRSPLPLDFLRVIYRAADSVLANSGHEPFGIVGLEAMAAGGIAFTGCTGEDYAIPFVNAFVLETSDPAEITNYVTYLREYPDESKRIRRMARRSARHFTWEAAAKNLISRVENRARVQEILAGRPEPLPLPGFEFEAADIGSHTAELSDTVPLRHPYAPHPFDEDMIRLMKPASSPG